MFIYTGVLVLNSLSVEIKGRLSTLSTGRVHMGVSRVRGLYLPGKEAA